jgi:hypothetical protein
MRAFIRLRKRCSPQVTPVETRSPEVADMLQKYDDLLAKRVQDTLTAEETTLLATIENELRENLSLPGETPEQRAQYQRMQAYIRKTMQQEPEQ